VSVGRSLTDKRCCRELAERAMVQPMKASADNKEAAGCTRDLTTANMATTVFVVDTQHQEITGVAQHWAVAE
jgi:hypothetical protein